MGCKGYVLPPPDKIATGAGAKYNAEDDVSAEEQFHWKMILENDPAQAIAKENGLSSNAPTTASIGTQIQMHVILL
jgi:hypothetical protein